YPLARQGRGAAALALSGIGSFVGGTLTVVLLSFLAVPLARLAVRFGPAEYVALMTLAFALLVTMGQGRMAKTWIAISLGLLLAMVGIDGGSGVERFTFDSIELLGGIDFTVLTIGLFAVSEILVVIEGLGTGKLANFTGGERLRWPELRACLPAMMRAT
ncbi:tripartite tricarboxylate transporter permease, partial [Terrabacter sp. 2RAF25]|uniref:tripartite tricarboxylate transporter permease n=1 Tax=Terrabacter sp. 2RAF25 TaxID=3232998 RepID=UPI003F95A301